MLLALQLVICALSSPLTGLEEAYGSVEAITWETVFASWGLLPFLLPLPLTSPQQALEKAGGSVEAITWELFRETLIEQAEQARLG